ncbi:MAG: hypothetical protein KJO07_15050, partial [Deltaproteobacteria bacterium]|nr:hypothetical protein [Deltaproteobacteria bacterium]
MRSKAGLVVALVIFASAGAWIASATTFKDYVKNEAQKKAKEKAEGWVKDKAKEEAWQKTCEASGTQGLTCKPPPDPSDCVEQCLERNREAMQKVVDDMADFNKEFCTTLGTVCDAFKEKIGPAAGNVTGDLGCKLTSPPECDPPEPEPEPDPDPAPPPPPPPPP